VTLSQPTYNHNSDGLSESGLTNKKVDVGTGHGDHVLSMFAGSHVRGFLCPAVSTELVLTDPTPSKRGV